MIRKVTAYGVNVDFIGILFSELRSPSFQNTKINGNISDICREITDSCTNFTDT